MRSLFIVLVLMTSTFLSSYAQQHTSSSEQSRSIEVNNDNGSLSISFINGLITEFIINDEPVSRDRYDNYQEIIDEFSDDGNKGISAPKPPTPPSPPSLDSKRNNGEQTQELRDEIVNYLMNEGVLNNSNKFKIELRQSSLKVNGDKQEEDVLVNCLKIFKKMYGHHLNAKSKAVFKKAKSSTSSSVNIVD